MQSLSDIIITPVANGFVVCLPRIEENPYAQIMPVFKDMQKSMEKDPLLSELQEQNISPAQEENQILKDQNQFVFTRFKDVIIFLSEKYGNQ